jgi:hypothetical protein
MPETETEVKVETTTDPAKPVVEQEVKADEFDKDRAMQTIEKLREFEKLSKIQAKKLAEYDAKEKERIESELSETDKLKKQLAEKEAQLNELTRAQLQREAAEAVGLPSTFASRLKGETLEDLTADAKLLFEALPKPNQLQTKVGATNPGSSATGTGETDEQKLARIHGRGVNIFDPVTLAKLGGGVKVISSTEE